MRFQEEKTSEKIERRPPNQNLPRPQGFIGSLEKISKG